MDTQLSLVATSIAPHSCHDQGGRLAQRIFLYANELYRVPASYRHVRTQQGTAYISHGGHDFIVPSGECVNLGRGADAILVSPLRSESLVLELFV